MNTVSILTQREHEVLVLLAEGKPNKEIARFLKLSESTIGQHLDHIYRKLAVGNRVQASRLYWRSTPLTTE